MRNNKQKSSGPRFLWFITGMLVMLFICGLIFLKKRVTIVVNGQQSESVIVSNANGKPAAPAAPHHADGSLNKQHGAKPSETAAADQYDFYTMLPNMQVKQATPNTPAPTPAPAPKPTKPLASAEQAMLAPQAINSSPAASSAQTAPTPAQTTTPKPSPATGSSQATATSAAPAPAPAATAAADTTAPNVAASTTTVAAAPAQTKYIVVAGTADSASAADALRAQLVLNGVDHIHIKKLNGKYFVIVGNLYSNKADAAQASQTLNNNGVKATVTSFS